MRHEKNVEEKEALLRELFRANPHALQSEAARALKKKFGRGLRKERIYEIRKEVRMKLQGQEAPVARPEKTGMPILVRVTPEEQVALERVVRTLSDQGLVPVRIDHQGEGYTILRRVEDGAPAAEHRPEPEPEPIRAESAATH